MLTFNNKILKVGNGALKFPTPRNLSIVFKPVSNQGILWTRDSTTSTDDWPEDFGNSDWMCSTVGGGFWEDPNYEPYIIRQQIVNKGAYSRDKKSYFYRTFFQMGSSDSSLTWLLAQSTYQATMEAGYSDLNRKSTNTFYSGMYNILFNKKLGTFDKNKQTYFAYLAWNNDDPQLYNFGYCRILKTTRSPTVTFKEQL